MNIPTYKLDKIIIGLIAITLLYTFYPKFNGKIKKEVIIDESAYEAYPLMAWKDTHEKWDGSEQPIVKIKYRVFNDDTFIEVVNSEREIVHTQPFQRSPWDDGRFRDFTYAWRLYESEWSDEIEPGEYQIRVCYKYSRNIDKILDIII